MEIITFFQQYPDIFKFILLIITGLISMIIWYILWNKHNKFLKN